MLYVKPLGAFQLLNMPILHRFKEYVNLLWLCTLKRQGLILIEGIKVPHQ